MKYQRYSSAISDMYRDPSLLQGSREQGMRYLTKMVSETLRCHQVRYWQYHEAKGEIYEECCYDARVPEFRSGELHPTSFAPNYFSAFKGLKVMTVNDTSLDDTEVIEVRDSYLIPTNIRAVINAPVHVNGQIVGLICCEVMGETRQWDNDDRFFLLNCTDFFARVVENDQRVRYMSDNVELLDKKVISVLRTLPFPMALLDRDFRFLAVSSRLAANYPAGTNLIGVRIEDAQPNWKDEWFAPLRTALAGKVVTSVDFTSLPSGKEAWLEYRITPWYSIDGGIAGVLLVYDDVTSRKENELQLRQAAKLSALGEMAGGIAHEINNPLSILKGFIDLMRRQVHRGEIDVPTFQVYMDRSFSTVERISRIVKGMKRIARDSSNDEFGEYGVNALIEDTLDFVQEKCRDNGIELRVVRLMPEREIHCRAVEISQVLLNLLTNSIHALEGKANSWIKIDAKIDNGFVQLAVEDSGKGIDPAVREKIFQPFYTTKDIGKGTGLGLSISRRIIENHGGRLILDTNAPNTRFVLEFPLR